MNLRTILAATFAAAVVATPAAYAAGAQHDTVCDSATARNTANDGGPAAATRVGACVDGLGYVEVGVSGTKVYVVASSDDLGYVGLSNFENGTSGPCTQGGHDANEGGSGSNGGGCYGVDGVPGLDPINLGSGGAVPLPVCGDGTGEWYDSNRDGCRADAGDVTDTINELLPIVLCVVGNPTAPQGCL